MLFIGDVEHSGSGKSTCFSDFYGIILMDYADFMASANVNLLNTRTTEKEKHPEAFLAVFYCIKYQLWC